MHYQNEGFGFLYTADGRIISFPDDGNKIDMSTLPTLDQVDNLISHANGFKALLNRSKPQKELLTTVEFKGEEYLALVSPITDETMALDWRVGFMVPMHAINDPVTKTTYSSIFSVILVLLLTSFILFQHIYQPMSIILNLPILCISRIKENHIYFEIFR